MRTLIALPILLALGCATSPEVERRLAELERTAIRMVDRIPPAAHEVKAIDYAPECFNREFKYADDPNTPANEARTILVPGSGCTCTCEDAPPCRCRPEAVEGE